MKENRPSQTAVAAAFLRGLSQACPPERRIINDPLARRLIPRAALRLLSGRRLLARRFARGVDCLAVRDRVADDSLRAQLQSGTRQLVVLGAGWDTAAFRLVEEYPAARCYEVDHPATQEAKRRRIVRLQWNRDERVVFVPCDFETDDFEQLLTRAGFDPQQPSAIKWMGVTYYLTLKAINDTLAALRRLMAPGSDLTFDYWLPNPDVRRSASPSLLSRLGEPPIFTPDARQISEILQQHGFTIVDELTMSGACERFPVRNLGWRDAVRFVTARRTDSPTTACNANQSQSLVNQ